MKKNLLYAVVLAASLIGCSQPQDNNTEIENKVEALLQKMTIEEKLGQMNQLSPWNFEELAARVRKGEVGSILNVVNPEEINKIQKIAVEESRLGIPILVSRDVIHGYKTIFPIPLGQAATFNPQIAEDGARVAAIEASADGIRWTFAPMIDISRDPRWGRIAESCGEDPYLSSVMGAAMIKGYQGDSLNDPTAIAACAKHFVAYGAAEGGKDYNSTFIPERVLRNVYLPPFKAAVEAGCATFMTSFNDNDGVPSTANKFVLKDVLRDEWKYDGMVVTDWASAAEMINHGFCVDGKDAAEKSVNAGVDMEMVSETFIKNLKQSVAEKKVSMETIDNAVRNILRLKFRLGLFENPYVVTPQTVKYADAHLQVAKTAAEQSVILLKNDAQTLPFTDKVKTVAVVGPMADAPYEQMGTWVFDGEKEHTQTPLKAIREMYGDKVNVIFEQGLAYSRDKNVSGIAKAVNAARRADVVVCFVGEESILSGEAHSLANLDLQGAQSQLIKSLAATGKPVVIVVMAGRQLTISDEVEVSDAVLYSFHPGTMGGPAIADILFGKVNPSGKTPVTFPRMTGQAPIYYAHNNTGRPANPTEMLIDEIPVEAGQTSVGCRSFYLDAGNSPLFPFGYGLSYTNFEYSDLKLASDKLTVDGEVNVSVNLKNAGKYDGTEVVQLYVQDKVGSVTRPVKELKAFQRVELKAGESKTVTFTLPVSDLAFWRYDMTYGVEPGDFKLWVGTNSAEGLSADFTVID
ncbi:Periplasmic beta-glucosidase precursor [uncultured Bacteroides sp.]|uniref:glycoside hydrolase family 3 N-terminal domain-containing protein n=1 Tax=Bacteroides cellulolyticus TaxID=2981780 RepID=UPI0008216449|nr:glycoside hydrolase family 3 N-terminal domain-containing protein [Bacteroides cellulolyticus]MCU6770729.1 glycoside hydrolase family 3 C-terminal domain-containing protein [Bacteroides cellulolyticus]SCH26721.1 Periplasmic beta-glucosidase precursor [uncultured Bacteroides sp.]